MISHSFMFFAKERCIFCVLFRSLEKNGKEQNVLLGFISRQKLKKRTEKNIAFFKRMEKERNVQNGKRPERSERKKTGTCRTEKNAVPNLVLDLGERHKLVIMDRLKPHAGPSIFTPASAPRRGRPPLMVAPPSPTTGVGGINKSLYMCVNPPKGY